MLGILWRGHGAPVIGIGSALAYTHRWAVFKLESIGLDLMRLRLFPYPLTSESVTLPSASSSAVTVAKEQAHLCRFGPKCCGGIRCDGYSTCLRGE